MLLYNTGTTRFSRGLISAFRFLLRGQLVPPNTNVPLLVGRKKIKLSIFDIANFDVFISEIQNILITINGFDVVVYQNGECILNYDGVNAVDSIGLLDGFYDHRLRTNVLYRCIDTNPIVINACEKLFWNKYRNIVVASEQNHKTVLSRKRMQLAEIARNINSCEYGLDTEGHSLDFYAMGKPCLSFFNGPHLSSVPVEAHCADKITFDLISQINDIAYCPSKKLQKDLLHENTYLHQVAEIAETIEEDVLEKTANQAIDNLANEILLL